MARPRSTYKRNFLDNVVIRFDFDNVELAKLGEYSKFIEGNFPLQEQKDGQSQSIQINIQNGEVVRQGQAIKTWEYLNATRSKRLTVTSQFLHIEYLNKSYSDKKELIEDFRKIITPFFTKFGITTINRVGLRYVNNINLNSIKKDFNWRDYFHLDLLGGVRIGNRLGARMARAMSQIEIKFEKEDLRFRFGIWNEDYPNENTRQEFIMDIDCYSRFPVETELEIEEVIKRYNLHAEEIFEKSVTEEFRSILRKKK